VRGTADIDDCAERRVIHFVQDDIFPDPMVSTQLCLTCDMLAIEKLPCIELRNFLVYSGVSPGTPFSAIRLS
jgi:hypothetical protein